MSRIERENSIFEKLLLMLYNLSELRDVYRAEFYTLEKEKILNIMMDFNINEEFFK